MCSLGKQAAEVVLLGIAAFDNPIVHTTGAGNLLGVAGFGLYHGVINHVIAFNFYDQIASIILLHQEVWVITAHGMGVGVDVLDEKLALTVGEHSGKENLLHSAIAEQIPEQRGLGLRVETVGVQVKAFCCVSFIAVAVWIDSLFRLGGDGVIAGWVRCMFDQLDIVRFGLFLGLQVIECIE